LLAIAAILSVTGAKSGKGMTFIKNSAAESGKDATLTEAHATMEYMDIVQTLCRTGLATGSPAVRQQVERLRDALRDSEPRVVSSLTRMLNSSGKTIELRPNRLIRAAQSLPGEVLKENVILPVDRETSVPIAEVIMPDRMPAVAPVLHSELHAAITSLLSEWSHVELLRSGGVEPATSALIYGAPGTGKTQLALWIGGQLGLPTVLARLDGLISSFLGTTSRNIGSLFAFAQRYKCLLLLDEFDSIAKMRDDPQEVGEIKRVVNTLLQNLDTRRRIGPTIAITNHEGLLDPAIWRRFDVQIALDVPGLHSRLQIIRRYAPPIELSEPQVRLLAWFVASASGAEIETLLRSIKRSYLILDDPTAFNLITAIREYAHLNSGRLDANRLRLVRRGDQALARALALQEEMRFDQHELAQLFGVHRSTIARWIAQPEEASQAELVHA
jgi:hypothetical protein